MNDWQAAGLLKPSFVRPKIAVIDPKLIVHQVGQLSSQDLDEVDRRLRRAMDLTISALPDIAQEIDLAQQSPAIVQVVAEKAVAALVTFSKSNDLSVDLERIRKLL